MELSCLEAVAFGMVKYECEIWKK